MKDAITAALIVVGLLVVVGLMSSRSDALEAETLEAAIPALRDARDSAEHVADSLEALAVQSDSIVVAVREQAAVESARLSRQVDSARRSFAVQGDSLRARVDSIALRMVDERDAMFEVALASKDSIIAVRDSTIVAVTLWGESWRDASLGKNALLATWDSLYTQEVAVNHALRQVIAGQKRKSLLTQVVAVAAVVVTVVVK
jgi:hypothetical protein